MVIVCDDDISWLTFFSTCAENTFEDLIMTQSGNSLLEVLEAREEQPCLVFLDLNMIRKTGIETAIEIKKINPTIPIIVMSADITRDRLNDVYKTGLQMFLRKEYNVEYFSRRLASIKETYLHHCQ